MQAPKDLKYSKSHEWVRVDGESATIGISDYAQEELGDITYVELPDVGETITAAEPLGIVESVKAATDIYAPLDGEVTEQNESVIESPELVNQSPYDSAWILKVTISDAAQIDALMDAAQYETFVAELSA